MAVINSELFKRRYGIPINKSLGLSDIARLSGFPLAALREVYSKGMGAYKTNRASVKPMVKSPQQWAMGRVYSFVMRRETTFGDADKSIAVKYNL